MSHVATVTIDHTKVAGNLTDFPVYVDLADLPSSFWNTVANGGGDIRVFKSDGITELPREVVSCNTSTQTGELHFKYTGTLSSSVDTEVQIHADGTSADYAVTDTYGRNAVWSDYGLVSHNGGLTDSTGNSSVTNNGVTTVSGKIGLAGTFNGSSNYVSYANNADIDVTTNDFSVTAWVKTDTLNNITRMILEKGHSGSSVPNYQNRITGANKFNGGYENSGGSPLATANTHTPSTGVWYYFTVTNDRDGNSTIFIDATSHNTATGNTTSITNTTNATIGAQRLGSSSFQSYWDGEIDEIRLIESLLSANWITTEYNNQNSPSTFYTATEPGVSVEPPVLNLTTTFHAPSLVLESGIAVEVPVLNITSAFNVPTLGYLNPIVMTPPSLDYTLNLLAPTRIKVGEWAEKPRSTTTWSEKNRS